MTPEKPIKRAKNGKIAFPVTFTAEQVTPAEKRAMIELGKEISVPGFRAGHVPEAMLREKVNPQALLEETVRQLLPDTITALVKEHDLHPITHPHIELTSREPLTVTIIFLEKPEVTIKGANKISVEKKEPTVDEKELKKMIDYILEKHQTSTPVDRAAKEGDRITMDFWGEDESKKEIEGTRSQGHQVVIGSKTLIPGFEDALVGLKTGDKKSFTITFPKKYHAEALQDKPVTFHVTVNAVEEVSTPKVTDEFAKEHLGAESAASFTKDVEDSMLRQEQQIENQRRERHLLEAIRNATQVELPTELISEETRAMIQDFQSQLGRQGLGIEDWFKQTGKKAEEFMKDMEKQAADRLTLRLGIEKLIEEKGITVTDEEVQKAIDELLGRASHENRDEIAAAYKPGLNAYEQLKWQKRVDALFDSFLK